MSGPLETVSLTCELYALLVLDAARYRYVRQIDRCDAWSSLLAPNLITRTQDIDAAIDAAIGIWRNP